MRRTLTRIILAAAAAGAMAAAPLAVSMQSASADYAGNSVCHVGFIGGVPVSIPCIWTSGGNGSALSEKDYYADGAAQTYVEQSAECGTVGPGCAPFVSGSGMNSDMTGMKIITEYNPYYNNCMAANGPVPQERACVGNNQEVWVKWLNSGAHSYFLVNVSYSNQQFNSEGFAHSPWAMNQGTDLSATSINGGLGDQCSGDCQLWSVHDDTLPQP